MSIRYTTADLLINKNCFSCIFNHGKGIPGRHDALVYRWARFPTS